MWEEQRNFVNERGLERRKLIIQDKRGTKSISMKKIETGSFKRKIEERNDYVCCESKGNVILCLIISVYTDRSLRGIERCLFKLSSNKPTIMQRNESSVKTYTG